MLDGLALLRDRYSGPWTVEDGENVFVVRAADGARLAWIHYRDLPSEWRLGQFYALDRAEALAMARAIARLGPKKKARRVAGLVDQLELFDGADAEWASEAPRNQAATISRR